MVVSIGGKNFTLHYQENELWRFNDKMFGWVRAGEGEFIPGRTIRWYVTPEAKVVAIWWWWIPPDEDPKDIQKMKDWGFVLRPLQ